jgi:hypothetical protein
MLEVKNINDLLEFQISKDIMSLAKVSLEELEKFRNYSSALEKIMLNAGFDDGEYQQSEEEYLLARKQILSKFNDKIRNLKELLEKFDIEFKKKE